MLVYKGKIDAKKTGSYQNRTYAVLQFVERRDDGAIRLVEVNLPDGADHSAYEQGKEVELPVTVSAKDNKVYFRAVEANTSPRRPPMKAA
jgi:hypothetical protein